MSVLLSMHSEPRPRAPVATHAAAAAADAPLDADALFRRYAPYVAAIALRLLGRHDEVSDLVQDVFLDAVRGLHAVREPAAIKGWLATVTVRLARRRLRVRRVRAVFGFDDAPGYDDVAAPEADPDARLLLERVYAALDSIAADDRIAWTLRHIENEPLDTVAALCGCSLATAKRRITRAHDALRGAVDHV